MLNQFSQTNLGADLAKPKRFKLFGSQIAQNSSVRQTEPKAVKEAQARNEPNR